MPLHDILAELLAKNDLTRVADLEFRAACALAEMEISGIGLNSSGAGELLAQEEIEVLSESRPAGGCAGLSGKEELQTCQHQSRSPEKSCCCRLRLRRGSYALQASLLQSGISEQMAVEIPYNFIDSHLFRANRILCRAVALASNAVRTMIAISHWML